MATLDAEFLKQIVYKAAGHTNQSRIAPKITDESTLSQWLSGERQPRDGSLQKIAGFVFDDLKRKDMTEYNQAEDDFIGAVHFLRECQAGERSIDDHPPKLAFEFLVATKRLTKRGRIKKPPTKQKNLSNRNAASKTPKKKREADETSSPKHDQSAERDLVNRPHEYVARPVKLEEKDAEIGSSANALEGASRPAKTTREDDYQQKGKSFLSSIFGRIGLSFFLLSIFLLVIVGTGLYWSVDRSTNILDGSELSNAIDALRTDDMEVYVAELTAAAERQNPVAQMALAVAYGIGHGVSGDPRLARLYSDAATENGIQELLASDPIAQYFVGLREYHGVSTPEDIDVGLALMRQAKIGGFDRASFQLASHSWNTAIQDDDCAGFDEAVLAHSAGHALATDLLADMTATDFCRPAELTEARELYGLAADAGVMDSMFEFAIMLDDGTGGPSDHNLAFELFTQLAPAGYLAASIRLGEMYFDGRGDDFAVDQNPDIAIEFFSTAAEAGNAYAMNWVGYILYQENRGEEADIEAAAWFRRAALDGAAWGQTNYGYVLLRGEGVEENATEARYWLELAAGQENATAQRHLGWMLMSGVGGDQDSDRAFLLMEAAAANGNVEAQNWLGVMYRDGIGTRVSPDDARHWFQVAADNGNNWAPFNLSRFLLTNDSSQEEILEGVALLDLSIERGLVEALTEKALLFRTGEVVQQDFGTALSLFSQARELGNTDAIRFLALMHERGEGVERDIFRAVELYQDAADLGDSNSQNTLGWLYQYDPELGIDYELARDWYLTAAENGNTIAQVNLGNMYRLGIGGESDPLAALHWLEIAAEASSTKAMSLLGLMHMQGDLGEQDLDRATQWFEMAIHAGDYRSSFELGWMQVVFDAGGSDEIEAFERVSYAASENIADAQAALSVLFSLGIGTSPSDIAAVALCQASQEQASIAFGSLCAGVLYYQLGPIASGMSSEEGFLALAEAGKHGISWAHNLIGVGIIRGKYDHGDLGIEDAVLEFEQGMRAGNDDAAVNLLLARLSLGQSQESLTEVIDAIRENAAMGHRPSQEVLAYVALQRDRSQPDLVEAAGWFVELIGEGFLSQADANRLLNEAALVSNRVIFDPMQNMVDEVSQGDDRVGLFQDFLETHSGTAAPRSLE